eukprot:TRINITY_DN2785_c0_g1_i12.p1 TRINITY_DN2785_c0_g1~~TRINITY_DN2785_c0_g1_i12.p1  ORF type:complete len:482 (+),score=78.82 TRINITY_DN2785_c0_g1_i12:438-1883(+)
MHNHQRLRGNRRQAQKTLQSRRTRRKDVPRYFAGQLRLELSSLCCLRWLPHRRQNPPQTLVHWSNNDSGANADGRTQDNLTALHLAASQNQLDIIKLLVDKHKADINSFNPSYGTPLHCAANAGHTEVVSYLLRQGARTDIEIEGKLLAGDVCVSEEIKAMIEKCGGGEKDAREKFYKDLLIPARPPGVRGVVYVVVPECNEPVKRYFFLDLTEYQFVMYKDKSHYPDNHMGRYPLIQMRHVKKVPNITKDKKYYSFKFEYNGKHILCCENKLTTDIWIDYLNSALEYAKFVKKVSENIASSETVENVKNMMKELLRVANTNSQPEVELEDTNQESVSFSKSLSQEPSEEIKDLFKNTENVNIDSFGNMDKDMEKIGHGAFGSVFKVKHKDTGRVYAMKVVSKNFLYKTKQLKYAISESQVLRIVDHPFIIKYCWYELLGCIMRFRMRDTSTLCLITAAMGICPCFCLKATLSTKTPQNSA